MSSAAKEVGIIDKKITNHSVRKTMIQRLVDSKFTPNEVAQLSGHKNLKSLDSYMTTSNETQKQMSLMLSGGTDQAEKPAKASPINPRSQAISSHIPAASGLFSNASMTGCSLNIAINMNTALSTEPNSQRPPKRRRIIINDSDSD